MEVIQTKPSAYHLTAIATLAQSPIGNILNLNYVSLEDIQEMVLLFGGRIETPIMDDAKSPLIFLNVKVGNCLVSAFSMSTNLSIMLQKESFGGHRMDFVKGSKLSIIDNQYFVLSENQD
jgi:hypothetical protein